MDLVLAFRFVLSDIARFPYIITVPWTFLHGVMDDDTRLCDSGRAWTVRHGEVRFHPKLRRDQV